MTEQQLATITMTYEQAQNWKGRLCQSAHNFRDLLIEGYESQAWIALGYSDYTQCLNAIANEAGFSAQHAWRELRAAKIEQNLLTNWLVDNDRIPESHLRPLSGLDPDQQREAWQEAVRTAPNGKVTGAHVESVVKSFKQELPKAMVYEREEQGNGGVVKCSRCHELYDGSKIEYCPYCAYTQEQRIQHLWHEQEKRRQRVHFSSETPEWYTPKHIIDRVICVLGQIDLDPCSNDRDNPNVPAIRHYTQEDDGLTHPWQGRVYMNPPYGREIADWVNHLCQEWEAGRTIEAIALVPARPDTEWFRQLRQFPKCFVWGRLKFSEAENSAPFPSMLVYLGNNLLGFLAAFCDIGDTHQVIDHVCGG